MFDELIPIGKRHKGLDGTELATSSFHLNATLFDKEHTIGAPVTGPVWEPVGGDKITAAPPRLDELSAYQHRYYQVDFRPGQDSSEPDQPVSRPIVELENAQTWSSELVDSEGNRTGYHTVMLDIDHPVRLVPSSTEGHYHLYIDHPIKEQVYFDLLRTMALAGVIEWGYYEASRARGGTHLRLPWVKKDLAAYAEAKGDEVPAELDRRKFDAARDGVNQAIPAELDRAMRQSQDGDVEPADQKLLDAFQETLDEVDGILKARRDEDDDPDDSDERLAKARAKFAVRYDRDGETVEWDVEQYEVAYVDGYGVLRRRDAAKKSQDPQA